MHEAKRWAIRLFVLTMFGIIAIETLPRRINWSSQPVEFGPVQDAKAMISPFTCQTGLWQGEWPLFAPDPILNNAWLSAEIHDPDGKLTMEFDLLGECLGLGEVSAFSLCKLL
ncbi:MAG: hypothetical protein R3C53_16435 [Pirellulaceae bacterium]